MAFTFIVEDGTIVASANSYITVEEADDRLEIDLAFFPIWDAMEDDEKEKRLAFATQWMEMSIAWEGTLVETTQALSWPRVGATDKNENTIGEAVIPTEVKQAELAVMQYFYKTEQNTSIVAATGVKVFRADTIQIEWQDDFFASQIPPNLRMTLNGLGWLLAGPGFKKIKRV